MVADGHHLSIQARRLAERLRDLREREGEPLTQKQLAGVLGGSETLSTATISLWEKPGSDRLPPPPRLAAYARLFCTSRSFASEEPRLLGDDELTEREREREAELYDELLALRELAQSTELAGPPGQRSAEHGDSLWRFPDQAAISIVCSDAPDPPAYAQPSHLNYSRYARYADLDAIVEVYGQARAYNPRAPMIRLLPPHELVRDFALNHLVVVGGAAVYDVAPYFAQDIPLPRAEMIPGTNTHLFKCTVEGEEREFTLSRDEAGVLVEDVGLIARGPHPNVPERTVIMLSGLTSRGVHGAALGFINRHVKTRNEEYLRDAFGNADAFCVVVRVPVWENLALPPNLWRDDARLYEWSSETGARW
jgi:hypothetical protein